MLDDLQGIREAVNEAEKMYKALGKPDNLVLAKNTHMHALLHLSLTLYTLNYVGLASGDGCWSQNNEVDEIVCFRMASLSSKAELKV